MSTSLECWHWRANLSIRGFERDLRPAFACLWDSTQPPPVNPKHDTCYTATSVCKGRAGRAMPHYQIGSRSLTILVPERSRA